MTPRGVNLGLSLFTIYSGSIFTGAAVQPYAAVTVEAGCCLWQERDGYKSIIASYESEVTMSAAGGPSDPLQRHNLEEVVCGLRKHAADLEADLDKAASDVLHYKAHSVHVCCTLLISYPTFFQNRPRILLGP